MTTRIWTGTCAAITFGLAAGLVAQTPQSTSAKNITVTGCIQRAAPGPTGTSGTTGATRSTSETKFLLTDAVMNPAGTTGTAGTTRPSTAAASEYRLDADDAKLTPHVGHKVEIAGTVEEPTSTTPPQPPSLESTASAANGPKLKVDTVRMISSTCP